MIVHFIFILYAAISLYVFSPKIYAAPLINSVTDNRSQFPSNTIPLYEKFEITTLVTNSVAESTYFPFDPSPPAGIPSGKGISVDGLFTSDNWATTYTIPGFFYQDFNISERNNRDWFYPTNSFSWKIRFAPTKVGNWQYRVRVQDASGVHESQAISFSVIQSANKGFVRVSPTDGRYFTYEDGTYFPGLGYNLRFNNAHIQSNESHLKTMGDNGIQVGRMWLSSWSIAGSQWHPWNAMPTDYDGYLPRSGLEAFDGDFRLKLVYRSSNPNNPTCLDNCSYWKATRFIGWLNPQPAVKPNTNYQLTVSYQASGITGPRNIASSQFGLVAKITSNWLGSAHNSGGGTIVSNYGGNTNGWTTITGTWNSGNAYFLPYLYLTLENVVDPGAGHPAATAYIKSVSLREVLPNNEFGPNIIYRDDMSMMSYADQRQSFAFDRAVELAQANNVFLRIVLMEKEEYIQNHIDPSGNLMTNDGTNVFYGSGRTRTAVRWYQEAYWRYAQARWGYSTAIHSWELLNEGNPSLANHYILADELGKYMRAFAPNHHMVSTSNWHSFPASSWSMQPNIDFADLHAYVSTGNFLYGTNTTYRELLIHDSSRYHMDYGKHVRTLLSATNRVMPIIRGEAGIDYHLVNGSYQNEQPDLTRDTNGVWLRNFIWAGLDGNGMTESYWWLDNIRNRPGPDGQTGLYEVFKAYYDFMKDIPLANGNYHNLINTANDPYRLVGQIDPVNNRAHAWLSSSNHTWRKVVDNQATTGLPPTIVLQGFTSNNPIPVQLHYANSAGQVTIITQTVSPVSGNLSIPLSSNSTYADVAIKIGTYSGVIPSPTPTSQAPPHNADVNNDGYVDFMDIIRLVQNFGRNGTGDINQNGSVEIFDMNLLVRALFR